MCTTKTWQSKCAKILKASGSYIISIGIKFIIGLGTYEFNLLHIKQRVVVGLDERFSVVEHGAYNQTEGEHVR